MDEALVRSFPLPAATKKSTHRTMIPRYYHLQQAAKYIQCSGCVQTQLKVSRLIRRCETLARKGAVDRSGIPRKHKHRRKLGRYARQVLKLCKLRLVYSY